MRRKRQRERRDKFGDRNLKAPAKGQPEKSPYGSSVNSVGT